MPWNKVPSKFKAGKLHSGSKAGPVVKSKSQMLAIMLSEKRKANAGKKEYRPSAATHPNPLKRKRAMYG
jgi:hypothetical protein